MSYEDDPLSQIRYLIGQANLSIFLKSINLSKKDGLLQPALVWRPTE
jgi:hypothetical protein